MREIEDLTTDTKIIEIRRIGVEMQKEKERLKKAINGIEAEISREIFAKVGYGIIMSHQQKIDIGIETRNKYEDQLTELKGRLAELNRKVEVEDMATLLKDVETKQESANTYNLEYHKLDPTYVIYNFQLEMPELTFTIDNEFDQNLMEMKMIDFNIGYQQSKQRMEVTLQLLDFYIQDNWSQGFHKYLIEQIRVKKVEKAPESTEKLLAQHSESNTSEQALDLQYVADETFDVCPFHIKLEIRRAMKLVLLIPMINELQRTMRAALSD